MTEDAAAKKNDYIGQVVIIAKKYRDIRRTFNDLGNQMLSMKKPEDNEALNAMRKQRNACECSMGILRKEYTCIEDIMCRTPIMRLLSSVIPENLSEITIVYGTNLKFEKVDFGRIKRNDIVSLITGSDADADGYVDSLDAFMLVVSVDLQGQIIMKQLYGSEYKIVNPQDDAAIWKLVGEKNKGICPLCENTVEIYDITSKSRNGLYAHQWCIFDAEKRRCSESECNRVWLTHKMHQYWPSHWAINDGEDADGQDTHEICPECAIKYVYDRDERDKLTKVVLFEKDK